MVWLQKEILPIDAYNEQWYRIAPINFMYEREAPRSYQISNELKKIYLNNENVSVSNLHGIANVSLRLFLYFDLS